MVADQWGSSTVGFISTSEEIIGGYAVGSACDEFDDLLGGPEGSRITTSCSFLISVLTTRLCRSSCAGQRVHVRTADVQEIPCRAAWLGSRRPSVRTRRVLATGAEKILKFETNHQPHWRRRWSHH